MRVRKNVRVAVGLVCTTMMGAQLVSAAEKKLPIPVNPPVARKKIELRVDQPTRTDRTGIPVTGGIPIPRGELASANNVRVLDPSGKETPSQVRTLSPWPIDGSVKVILVDFQANVPKYREICYGLEYGKQVKAMPRKKGITVAGGKGSDVTVDTGAIKFTVKKGGCGFLDDVYLSGKKLATGVSYARFKGEAQDNSVTVTSVEVEEGGDIPKPLRVVVKIEGTYDGHLKTPFINRIYAYAGKPYLRVYHIFVYNGSRFKEEDHMTNLEVGLALEGGVKSVAYALDGATPAQPRIAGGRALLYSRDDLDYTITGLKPGTKDSPKPSGWMNVKGANGSVLMGIRDFRQNYPKGLRIEGSKATLSLWPKEHAPFDLKTQHRFITYNKYKKTVGKWNDELDDKRDGEHQMQQGDGNGSPKMHELFFLFHKGDSTDRLVASFEAFREPSYLFVNPKWYADSRVFGFYNPSGVNYEHPTLQKWDNVLDLSARWVTFAQKYWRWYGMWDYGDFPAGRTAHRENIPPPRFPKPHPPLEHGRWDVSPRFKQNINNNCHYDLVEAMILQYLRTGNRDYFRFAEMSAMHVSEVDSTYIQDSKGRRRLGWTCRHSCGHGGTAAASHSFCHFRTPYYYLTGYERFKDATRLAYEFVRDNRPEVFGRRAWTVREFSRPIYIQSAWWELTDDPDARKHTKYVMDYLIRRQQTQGELGNYIGINKTWGKKWADYGEAFDAYNARTGKVEVSDEEAQNWPGKNTHGWRFMEFGGTYAMIDWYNLTGDEAVAKSAVRFLIASEIKSTEDWFAGQRPHNMSWRFTGDEKHLKSLEKYMRFSKYGPLGRKNSDVVVEIKDNMTLEDFDREFAKFHSVARAYQYQTYQKAAKHLLNQPFLLYAMQPYDGAKYWKK